MKNRLGIAFAAAAMSAAPFSVVASPALLSGPQSTLGNVSSRQSLLSVNANPAAGQLVLHKKRKIRWSYVHGPVLGFELGDIDNVLDEYDLLSDELDVLDENDLSSEEEITALANQFDDFLLGLSSDPVLSVDGNVHAPGLPLVFRSEMLKGVIAIDFAYSLGAGAQLIGDTIEAVEDGDGGFEADTNTALNVFLATVVTTSVGYSYDLGNPFSGTKDNEKWSFERLDGRLLVGGTLNLYNVTMATALEGILNVDEEDEDDDVSDSVLDSDENEEDSTALGLDLGALWVADNYQVGMTWSNINEPDFDKPDPSSNCTAKTGSDFSNCVLATELEASGRIDFNGSFTMESQLSIEGALTHSNKHWVVASALDLNEVEGLSGGDHQWLSVSASYFSDSIWVPSARLGYRVNLAGSELSYAGFGLTLFGGVNLDLGVALESIDTGGDETEEGELDDGDSIPRSAYVSLGVEHRF